MKRRFTGPLLVPLALLAACNGGGGEGDKVANTDAAAEGGALLPNEAEASALSGEQAAELANEAAADEAADMESFGGNAAAGDAGNGAR